MPDRTIVTTDRLEMRPYAPAHLEDIFKMNSDLQIMQYLGDLQTRDDVQASIARQQEKWAKHGFGWWSLFARETGVFVGSACLQHLGHIETNPLEIGWRLNRAAQGKGYATEAGQAAMDFAFNVIGETYLTAVTVPDNKASARVMERLGMTYIGIQTHYDTACVTYEFHKPK